MSIFSENRLVLPSSETICQLSHSSSVLLPNLAISTPTKILFYSEAGEKLDYYVSKNIPPSAIQYHPSAPILAIGWSTGLLTLFHEDTKMIKEEAGVHKGAILLIVFQNSGNCMVTSDEKGLVAVWRGINCLSTYQREGLITNAIFCELNFGAEAQSNKLKTTNLFFFGGRSGVVCLADSANHCSEVCKVGGAIKSLLFYEKENSVIIITSTLLLVQFKISPNEKTAPDKKVKLSIAGDPEKLLSIWIGTCLLATCSNENLLRMWHLEQDENYVLTLFDIEQTIGGFNSLSDRIQTMEYMDKQKLLIGGSREGKVLFWKSQTFGSESPFDTNQWKVLPYIGLDGPVHEIKVGNASGQIAVKHGNNNVSLISETVVSGKMGNGLKVLQIESKKIQIYLQNEVSNQIFDFVSKNNIKGMDCWNNTLLIWTGKKIELYEIVSNLHESNTKPIDEFSEKCISAALHGEYVILVKENSFQVATYKGLIKQTFLYSESEGNIKGYHILNNTMVLYTTSNYMKIYDLSKREFKQIGVTRRFEDSTGPLGELNKCSVNSNGSKVAIIASRKKTSNNIILADTKFFVYDLDMDLFMSFDLGPNRVPIDVIWDKNDGRFFVVLTTYLGTSKKVDSEEKTDNNENLEIKYDDLYKGKEISTFFCTGETGIKRQDNYRLNENFEGLFGLTAPKIMYIYKSQEQDVSRNYKIVEETLKDFSGIEKIDDNIIKSIMNFSFFLTTGNMDEAYKSVKSIQNPIIWENMAQMCVKTKRLDVAEICIGNMRFARGAKAIRESKKEEQLEAKLAMVAIQLNMKEEAENLYKSCKRYDLLNKMYQASGEWDKAIQIAETNDRINLKTTYYKTAKLLEISRNFEKAIFYYEKSGNFRKEVPRMLMSSNNIEMLEKYIEEKKDRELFKWWAQYMESLQKWEVALDYYQRAEDYSSTVRLYIFLNEIQKAKSICKETNDTAACYFLAKQLELTDQIEEAVSFYAKAQYYSLAVKLAREKGLENEIMSLSMMSPKQVMLQSAVYFESKGLHEKSVVLYMKGKNLKKALDIAVKAKLYDYIKRITDEINAEKDSEALEKAAQHFLDGNQLDKAIHLLIASKQIEKALELCIENNIPITEDIAKKIIPDSEKKTPEEEKKRQELIRLISKKAKKQGNFELASKYYIELGDKIKAIKCLIKLGDIERVVAFANNARMSEIYTLAANYLQTCDWHKNPEFMKLIITFYGKAKNFNHLVQFYELCASTEIDEYRDYEKALSALKDGFKYVGKITGPEREEREKGVKQKIGFVEKFLEVRGMREDGEEMVKICLQLLNHPQLETAIRAGDVYALLVEYYYENKAFNEAYDIICTMQEKNIVLNPFLDQEIIETIFSAVGKKDAKGGKTKNEENDMEAFQEEELIE